jgi:hypothetical protein
MVEIPQTFDGHPVFEAYYSLAADGGWHVRVQTENGEVELRAARLNDVERRGYEAVRRCGHESGTFDVTFQHMIDLAEGRLPTG